MEVKRRRKRGASEGLQRRIGMTKQEYLKLLERWCECERIAKNSKDAATVERAQRELLEIAKQGVAAPFDADPVRGIFEVETA